jgi:hypothetical protein
MRKHRQTLPIFCAVFLTARLGTFAQTDSNGNDVEMHDGTGVAVNAASWETRDLPNIRVRFKLPPGYKQKQWAIAIGSGPVATFQLGHVNEIDFTVENVEGANPESAKVIRQKDYVEYSEWSQLIGGHTGIVQTFKGGGTISDEQGKRPPYCVHAACAVDRKRLLRISGTLGNQERQREILRMLKTIELY